MSVAAATAEGAAPAVASQSAAGTPESVASDVAQAERQAEAARERFISGGAPEQSNGGRENLEEPEAAAADKAEQDKDKQPEKPTLKRRQPGGGDPQKAHERIKAKIEAQCAAEAKAATESETVAAAKAEVERLRAEGQTSQAKLAELDKAIKARDINAFVKLGGWDSVEAMTREFLEGKSAAEQDKPTKRELELQARLEAIEAKAKAEEEAKAKAQQEEAERRAYQEQLDWVREEAERHDVPEVRAALASSPVVRDNFLQAAHAAMVQLLEKDPSADMDEAFGMVLDSYGSVFDGLLPIFMERAEKALSQRSATTDAAGAKTGCSQVRNPEANRRGSTSESAKTASSSIKDPPAEEFTPDKANSWFEKNHERFLKRMNGSA